MKKMIKQLRNYQKDAVKIVLDLLKSSSDPVLIDCSVGAGKSLIAASILLVMEKAGYKSLCLTLNSTLIDQNYNTYQNQGGNSGVYCSSLKLKETNKTVIFASANSIVQAIKKKKEISKIPFQLIIVDEAQNISNDPNSMYQRIFKHYSFLCQENDLKFRLIAMTGTPYRGKSIPIYGENELFKKRDVHISMSWLIENNFLVKPVFGIKNTDSFDFSKLKTNSMGKFNNKELKNIIDSKERLTAEIMKEVVSVVRNGRQGAFIFCSTIAHCFEALRALPQDESRIVIGDTPHEERKKIMLDAQNGKVNYLVTVSCLLTGVDQPRFDVACFCRPTESLTLYIQAIGRVLRLHKGKNDCIILDHASNLERFESFDDPIINEALKPKKEDEEEFVIPCLACSTLNKPTARRCIGLNEHKKRCDNYFEWKDCINCHKKNDISAKYCCHCKIELIDPNAKLTAIPFVNPTIEIPVVQSKYWLQENGKYTQLRCSYAYRLENGMPQLIYESYSPTSSERAKNVFYGQFVRLHLEDSSFWYPNLQNPVYLKAMLNHIKSPTHLKLKWDGSAWKITKKVFLAQDTIQ